jgi:hypothetical protein
MHGSNNKLWLALNKLVTSIIFPIWHAVIASHISKEVNSFVIGIVYSLDEELSVLGDSDYSISFHDELNFFTTPGFHY